MYERDLGERAVAGVWGWVLRLGSGSVSVEDEEVG